MQPMPRAGGVRAFSHLPQPARAQADFSDPLSTRPATPVGRPRPRTEPDDDQDTGHAPEPDSDHDDDTAPQDHEDNSPWHMPRITAQDLPPQDQPEDAHAPAPKPRENTARSSRFDGAPPSDRSASTTRNNGFPPPRKTSATPSTPPHQTLPLEKPPLNKDEYNRLIQNPAEIARMFWNEMRPPDKRIPPREGTKHQTNTYRMPESSIYGGYDFTHVLKTLGNGITPQILKSQTPVRDEYQPGPN